MYCAPLMTTVKSLFVVQPVAATYGGKSLDLLWALECVRSLGKLLSAEGAAVNKNLQTVRIEHDLANRELALRIEFLRLDLKKTGNI